MDNLELLIGLLAIAVAIFFGLREFQRGVMSKLSEIKDAVIAIKTTVEKTWDLALRQSGTGGGTVERELQNLGKVRITAEPSKDQTTYLLEIEKPIFKEGLLFKIIGEPEFIKQETKILGKEGEATVLSPNRIRYYVPSTDPKACTEFVSFLLKELNSTYFKSLDEIKDFEEHILT